MMRMILTAVAGLALAAPAVAQEQAMGDAEILALADRQAVWCENWSDETQDCESLYTLRREPDGQLVLAGMFILSDRPTVQVIMAEVVTLENGRLCSSGDTDDLNIQASLAGAPSPEMSAMVRMLFAESMADYAQSTICQQFFTTGDPQFMGEIVTADDVRLYDFESTYRLGTFNSGFLLRPQIGDEPDMGMIDL